MTDDFQDAPADTQATEQPSGCGNPDCTCGPDCKCGADCQCTSGECACGPDCTCQKGGECSCGSHGSDAPAQITSAAEGAGTLS